MTTLEEFKEQWQKKQPAPPAVSLDKNELEALFLSKIKNNMRTSFQYFWASFGLQVLVYALLSHVIVKHWHDTNLVIMGLAGALLYIPFTVVLMRKFKKMALIKPEGDISESSLYELVRKRQSLLQSFYTFKVRYELLLIPVSTAIGTILTFNLYVPGGILVYTKAACVVFVLALCFCTWAIFNENRKSFQEPLSQLAQLLEEFKQ